MSDEEDRKRLAEALAGGDWTEASRGKRGGLGVRVQVSLEGLMLRTPEGKEIGLCTRDNGSEVCVGGRWFRVENLEIREMSAAREGARR